MDGLKEGRLPADTHWPETQYTLYSHWMGEGPAGKQQISNNLMKVYRGSLLQFYERVAKPGDSRFPRLPVREHATFEEHAEDVVHEYFAKRAGSLIEKWREYRAEHAEGRARHLRVFIRQDFRFHCLEMLRADLRYHDRARDLEDYSHDLEDELPPEERRELAQKELSALVRVAIERTIETFDEKYHADLRILAEERFLKGREYKDFLDHLTCNLDAARKRVVRFKERMRPLLIELIREQGDDLVDYLEDLE